MRMFIYILALIMTSGGLFAQSHHYIVVNKNSIYFQNTHIHRKVDANIQHFTVLDWSIAYDDKRVYYKGMPLEETPEDVYVFSYDYFDSTAATIWKNKEYVFYGRKKMSFMDIATTKITEGEYCMDKNHVVYRGKIIPKADPNTFIGSNHFSYDKKYVYQYGKRVKKRNQYLQPINNFYAKDTANVYTFDMKNTSILPGMIKGIRNSYYSIINDTLFYKDKNISYHHIDQKKIKVYASHVIAYDTILLIRGYKVIAPLLDIATLEVISKEYIKDKNSTYKYYYQDYTIRISKIEEKYAKHININTGLRQMNIKENIDDFLNKNSGVFPPIDPPIQI